MAPTTAEILQRNETYAASHNPMPTIDELAAMGRKPPSTAIITCIDPRVEPDKLLGLHVGECLIFRTVAGHPQAALHDLATFDLDTDGGIKDVLVIYHSDCGSWRFDVDKIRKGWVERDPSFEGEVAERQFGAVDKSNVDEYIKQDVEWLRSQPLMRAGKDLDVQGYLYDIKSGKLRKVT